MTSIITGFIAITAILLIWGLIESLIVIDVPARVTRILDRIRRHSADAPVLRTRTFEPRSTIGGPSGRAA